jgi:hypothetical protein
VQLLLKLLEDILRGRYEVDINETTFEQEAVEASEEEELPEGTVPVLCSMPGSHLEGYGFAGAAGKERRSAGQRLAAITK